MSEITKKRCVFGCDPLVALGVPSHRFPDPEKYPDLFAAWLSVIGNNLKETDKNKIYRNKRVCDHHFQNKDMVSGRRLKQSAIPSVNLHRVRQSHSTFVQADHCYTHPQRECFQPAPFADITNLPGPSRLAEEPFEIPLPSGSTETTCPVLPDKSQNRMPRRKFDAEKTFEFLQNKTQIDCARKIRQKKNEISRLRQKLKDFKIHLQQKQSRTKEFEKFTQNMSASAKSFVRMQFAEGHKKKKGHRFTLDEKILSLSFYKKSPKAYALMSQHFTLPSRKVLKSLLAQIRINAGINPLIFNEIRSTVMKMLPQDRLCTLMFDEMKITPQIIYNSYTDDLVGFENFGEQKTEKFADHALVFMVKGVKKKFKQPVAYYFTQNLNKVKLKELIKEVVTSVHATGLKVVATVCDQGGPNAATIHELVEEAKAEYSRAGKEWRRDLIIINNEEIIPLFDVPHLLKGIRNNLLNKVMKYTDIKTNKEMSVKWAYFQAIFEADKSHGELRLLPKLTREHIDIKKIRKMRVKNAAQLLSRSMAIAADNLVARGEVPVECLNIIPFVTMIDKLFDSLNCSSFSAPGGKKYRAAVTRKSPHHELWQEALQTLKTVKFEATKKNGIKYIKKIPTINNFIMTIEGFKSLWQLLSKKYGLDAMFTRNFNQDPLENFFGSVRSLGARNISPNCMGFEGAFKTLLLNNLSSHHAINSNCEDDSNDCLQSLAFLIKNKIRNDNAPSKSQDIVIDQPLDIMQNTISDTGADQRTYVCGWALTKCLQNVVKGCKRCKNKLLGDSKNEKYRYIHAKEFEKGKTWLSYPSDCLVACFHDIQNITIAFLNSECYKKLIKERIVAFVDLFVDFSFMDCSIHKEKLQQCFLTTTINIIIYSWCRTVNNILDGKLLYDGDDSVKKAAQEYYHCHCHSIK